MGCVGVALETIKGVPMIDTRGEILGFQTFDPDPGTPRNFLDETFVRHAVCDQFADADQRESVPRAEGLQLDQDADYLKAAKRIFAASKTCSKSLSASMASRMARIVSVESGTPMSGTGSEICCSRAPASCSSSKSSFS